MISTDDAAMPFPTEAHLTSYFLNRVRPNCFELSDEECSHYIRKLHELKTDSIFTQFKAGDKLYGFNGGTVPYIMMFYKAKLFDPYNLIIDPLYNTFLKIDHDVLGLPPFNDPHQFTMDCISYHQFFNQNQPLATLLKQDLHDRAKFADACIRMCKLGLLQTLRQGNKIYFVLDGLNMTDIASKKDKKLGNVPIGYYTNKEIRFCYRLNKLAPELASQISFWKDGQRVPAPWIKEPEVWGDYKPKMESITEELKHMHSLFAHSPSKVMVDRDQSSAKAIGGIPRKPS